MRAIDFPNTYPLDSDLSEGWCASKYHPVLGPPVTSPVSVAPLTGLYHRNSISFPSF